MVLRIGHRGARGYEPENTILSFKKALELNVDMVEFDVCRCKSGEIVVFHDKRVDKLTNDTGYVQEKTFEELRSYDIGKGQKIMSLQEALDFLDRKIKVNIEVKGENMAECLFSVLTHYVKEKKWSWDNFIISSFNHYELLAFKRLTAEVKIGAIIAGIPIGYAECAAKINAYSLHVSKEFINQALVDDAHNRGMKVFVYTPNAPEDIEKMKSMRVDGIFSDFPDRI
ncbi:MAG: glycerophosphodiester phosphodiesterase [Candidatus Omnitrophica bacterium]|nr:glycerophosphodiester phosphodiesterase [Candidatus Omnitrophota bacterium]